MPRLSQHHSQDAVKMLFIGDSGSGKTGALAALVMAGYELAILDFDNGLDILFNILRAQPNAEELLDRVYYETCTDKLKTVSGLAVPDGVPKGWSKALKLLDKWKTDDYDLGPVSTWGPNRVLVLDSLTFAGKSAYRYVDAVNAFKDGRQTYGEAQKQLEGCLALLYSDTIKCNVIVTSHITFVDMEGGFTKGYPSSIGKALSPQIPRYFNSVIEAKTKGSGSSAKHVIITVPDGMIELKVPTLPGKIPAELPLETGLAKFFEAQVGPLKK